MMRSQPPFPEAPQVSQPAAPASSAANELQLVAGVLRKDRKATADFVSRYADGLYAYVRHRLAPREDLIDDVVQDVFLAALASLPRYVGTSSLGAWLRGIARHKVEDYYRQRLREPEPLANSPDAEEPSAESPPLEEFIDRQRLEAKTQRVLRQLPEPYSVALLWRYWENRSIREMAAATGKTEKAFERLLARARVRFRQLWDQV